MGLNCPNCSSELRITHRYDAEVDYCPTCRGVWLDRGEIDKIANTQRRYEEDHYNRYHRRTDNYNDRYCSLLWYDNKSVHMSLVIFNAFTLRTLLPLD